MNTMLISSICCDLIGFRYLNNISDTTLLSAASFIMGWTVRKSWIEVHVINAKGHILCRIVK